MSVSEQLNGWSGVGGSEFGDSSGHGRGKIDTELASIVSSLSGFSGHNGTGGGSGREQQIGGFRRASFNSNNGSDVDSEILFGGQTSPMLRRTTLSVGGVSLGANTGSHSQTRLNGMAHYSASIAGGLTSQFQTNGGISGASIGSNVLGSGAHVTGNVNGGSIVVGSGSGNGSTNNGGGFFERFGRALAEGTREVESSTGTVGGSGGSRRESTSANYDISASGSTSMLLDSRRMSETSDALESVSESLNMQNAEPNPTTIWNVAAAPVFRPQNFGNQQQGFNGINNRPNVNGTFANNFVNSDQNSNGASVVGNTSELRSDSSSNENEGANEPNGYPPQPPFGYGYPTFNQFGVPIFLPPVLTSPTQHPNQSFFDPENENLKTKEGDKESKDTRTDGTTNSNNDNNNNNDNDNDNKVTGNGDDKTFNTSPIIPNGMPPYPFAPMYPFVYPLPNENGKEEGNDGRQKNMNGSTFIPPNMYMYMPPPPPGSNYPDMSNSQSPVENFGSKKSNEDKNNDKVRSNPYLNNGKRGYPQFSPSPPRIPIPTSMQPNHHVPIVGTKPQRQGKNNRSNNKQPIVRSALLEEFRNNQANKTYKLSDIYGSALEFCKDQHGSRFIQQELATANDAEKEIIFNEIRDEAISLAHDVFGNYVVQKFFEYGTTTQRNVLVDQFKGKMQDLSLEMYACRVIQKAFEFLNQDQKIELVSELSNSVLPMIKDQNGNHVIQKAIECIPIEKLPFILESLRGQIYHLSTHSYGCRVVQRLLEFGTIQDQEDILNDLDQFIPFLIQDQYGNYVIQHILQHGKEDNDSHISKTKQHIIDVICDNVVEYSKHKFASNVVEKSVIYGSNSQIGQILNKILPTDDDNAANLEDNAPLILMMRDQYANYVVQKLVGVASGQDQKLIVIAIRSYLDRSNKNNTLGNRHLASVEKLATLVENIEI